MMAAHTEQQNMVLFSANVFVAMGSTTTQGFYFDSRGNMIILFTEDFPNPPTCKTTDTVDNRNRILSFFNHLIQFNNEGNRVVFVNSIGYSIDGGKKKGAEIGPAYSLVDDIDNFTCKSFVGIMSEIVNEEGNEHLQGIFTIINRNYKTPDGQEISGQWTKRINGYLAAMGQGEWICYVQADQTEPDPTIPIPGTDLDTGNYWNLSMTVTVQTPMLQEIAYDQS